MVGFYASFKLLLIVLLIGGKLKGEITDVPNEIHPTIKFKDTVKRTSNVSRRSIADLTRLSRL